MRYFFNVHDGCEIIDDVGVELSSLDEARSQALIGAGEALREQGSEIWTSKLWHMYVVDETGKTVLRLSFSAESRTTENGTDGIKNLEPIGLMAYAELG